MAAVYEQYIEELHDKYGYLAAWLPNTKLRLGDVGILKRDRFEFTTTLNDLGIPFNTRDIGEVADYQYVSSDGANIEFHAGADATAVGAAIGKSAGKVTVLFKRANAVVFIAAGCKTTLIEQQDILGKEVLTRYQSGSWPRERVVITELVTAESATVLVSATDSAKADFSAESNIAPHGLSLADSSAGLQIASSSGVATQILAARQLTPLFRASGVRRRFLSGTSFDTRSGEPGEKRRGGESDVFSDVDYSDLE
jgi:hypothetical protein